MKKITMSVLASTLLAGSLYADSSSVAEAFEKGKVSGDISYYVTGGSASDDGYSIGSTSLNYETDTVNGFKASLGFITNTVVSEEVDGSKDDSIKSAMPVANISYTTDGFSVIAGRQEIGLEWIGDMHEAVVGVVTAIPNTTIIAGHTNKINDTIYNDDTLIAFGDINGDKGASVLDVAYSVNDKLSLGGYYMTSSDLFSAYGASVATEVSGLGVTAKYAASSEDVAGEKDGNIMALDLAYSVNDIALGAGYFTTDKDGGIGSLGTLGDSISPMDNGAHVYDADADTIYASVGTSVAGFDLSALYGTTDYGTKTEKELNLSASWECKFVKNLNVSLFYADIAADAAADDSDYYTAQLVYSF